MIHFLEEIDPLQVRILDQIFDRIDRAGRNVGHGEKVHPLGGRSRRQARRQECADLLRVNGARLQTGKSGVGGHEVGNADHRGELSPVVVGVDDDAEMAVLRRVRAALRRQQAPVAGVA